MIIGSTKEQTPEETRAALTPSVVKKLISAGHTVLVEKEIGLKAGFTDTEYQTAGAQIIKNPEEIYTSAHIILQITAPSAQKLEKLTPPRLVIADFNDVDLTPYQKQAEFIRLETVPRTSVAQSIDVLSAQSTVRGYASALYALAKSPRIAPQLMTAAASIKAAKALIIGASVTGLQAAAVFKRQGCLVTILDINDKAGELAASVGAAFATAATPEELTALITDKNFILAAASSPTGSSPQIIKKNLLSLLKNKAVVVDTTSNNIEMEENSKTTPAFHFYRNIATERLAPLSASELWANNMYNLISLLKTETETYTDIPEYLATMFYPPLKPLAIRGDANVSA